MLEVHSCFEAVTPVISGAARDPYHAGVGCYGHSKARDGEACPLYKRMRWQLCGSGHFKNARNTAAEKASGSDRTEIDGAQNALRIRRFLLRARGVYPSRWQASHWR
jgi:hypothetical protein